MSFFTFLNDNSNWLFIFIKFEPDFLRRKINSSIFKSLFPEFLRKIIQESGISQHIFLPLFQ